MITQNSKDNNKIKTNEVFKTTNMMKEIIWQDIMKSTTITNAQEELNIVVLGATGVQIKYVLGVLGTEFTLQ